MAFDFIPTALNGVMIIKPRIYRDDRGFFLEFFKQGEFRGSGIDFSCIQTNHSHSVRGVLRGLHYQIPPHGQAKIVKCSHGEIFDVAVDIRKNSPQFGKWTGTRLTSLNHEMLYIPEGFAHGFLTVSERADVIYLASSEYAPSSERGIRWDDPEIGIRWPQGFSPQLSQKDMDLPLLSNAEVFP
ncbi:dTDP-4-dehydrorhamnose 3,5-epimerase [bacterium]|nr:dTDP-4-dehydrorhamnose 3,5-epimerase [bacterium]